MPVFPQPIRSWTTQTVSGANLAYTAKTGDVVNANCDASHTVTVTLPPVSEGGPVTVRKYDSNAIAVKVVSADGSTVNGITGTTGVSTTTQYAGWTFETDGSNWWQTGS